MALKDIAINIKTTGVEQSSSKMREMRSATQQMADTIERAQRQLLGFASGVSLGVVAKEVIEAALAMERIQSSMQATFGKGQATARELQYVRDEANRLGLVFNDTALAYAKFSASTKNTSIEGEATRKVFSSVAEAVTALQLTGEESNGIFLALSQMMSKGKVSAEELTGQLGERLPGALKLAADAMGMTTQQLLKHMQQGEVLSSDLLPKLAEQLHKTYGQAAEESAQKGQSAINRFNNEVKDTATSIGSKLMPHISSLLEGLTEALKIMRSHDWSINPKNWRPGNLGYMFTPSPTDYTFGEMLTFPEAGQAAGFRDRNAGIDARKTALASTIDPQMSRALADQRATQEAINAKRKAVEEAAAAEEANKKAAQEADQQFKQYSNTLDGFNKQVRDNNPSLTDMEKRLLDVDAAVKKAIEATPQYSKSLTAAGEAIKQNIILSEEQKAAIKATSDEFKAYMQEVESQPLAPDYRNFSLAAEALEQEREDLRLTNRELFIQQQLRKSAAEETAEYADEVRRSAGMLYDEQEAMAKWKQTVERMDQTFHDGFVRMLEDGKSGWQSFTQSLAHTFKAEVADYVYQSLAKPFALNMAQGAGNWYNSGGGIGNLSSIFSSSTSASSAAKTADTISDATSKGTETGAMAGITAGFAKFVPWIGIAMAAYDFSKRYYGAGGLWEKSTSNQQYLRSGAMFQPGVNILTDLFSGNATVSSQWKEFKDFNKPKNFALTNLGMAAGPLAGWADWATGGGLFGTKWKNVAQGVELGVEDGDMTGDFYSTIKKKKSFWRGSKTKTTYSDLDAQWEEFIGRQYDSIINSMKVGAEMMGKDDGYVTQIMASFSSAATKINLKGKNAEQQQQAVSDYFRKLTNEALLKLYPEIETSIRLGEDAAAAWQRMNELRQTNNALLLQELELLGQKGGVKYMEILNQQREMELLNMDESTQAIQKRIWALQDEKEATQKLSENYTSFVDVALSAADALKDITSSNLTTLSPEDLYRQQRQLFNSTLASGNYTNLGEISKQFLAASQSYFASSPEYAMDYQKVVDALTMAAGMVEENPTLAAIQKQVDILEQIKDLLAENNFGALAAFAQQFSATSGVGIIIGAATNAAASMQLPGYAKGGITSGLSFAGETGPEAVVPLPDGRTIPVQMTGAADNYGKELVQELQELRREVAALRAQVAAGNRVNEAGFSTLAEHSEQTTENTKVLARNFRLTGAK